MKLNTQFIRIRVWNFRIKGLNDTHRNFHGNFHIIQKKKNTNKNASKAVPVKIVEVKFSWKHAPNELVQPVPQQTQEEGRKTPFVAWQQLSR